MRRSQNFVTKSLKPEKSIETHGTPRKSSLAIDNRYIGGTRPVQIIQAIAGKIGNVVSSKTVRPRLVSAKLPSRIVRKIPLLTTANLKSTKL